MTARQNAGTAPEAEETDPDRLSAAAADRCCWQRVIDHQNLK